MGAGQEGRRGDVPREPRRPVIHVESPLRPQPGDPGWPRHLTGTNVTEAVRRLAFDANQKFAKDVCLRIVRAGGLPQAPHLFFPLFLDDFKEDERNIGLEAGIQLQRIADEVWFTLPPWREAFSEGMQAGMDRAQREGLICVMAQMIPHQHGARAFASKLDYHLDRLRTGIFDLR